MLMQVKLFEWDKTRDFFPALALSGNMKDITVEDILSLRYPRKAATESVNITHDPDRGAVTSREVRENLGGIR